MVRFGVFKDIEVGDHELDDSQRFSATEEGMLRSLFDSERVRTATHELVAGENFNGLQVREDRVEVKWVPRSSSLDEDPDVLRGRLETATRFLEACSYSPRIT